MYNINNAKKLITIYAGTLTEQEQKEVDDFIKYSGYATKVARAKQVTTAKITNKDILSILKDDKAALEAYQKAKEKPSKKNENKTVGFLGGKRWFIANHKEEYIAFLKKTKQTAALEAFQKNKKK